MGGHPGVGRVRFVPPLVHTQAPSISSQAKGFLLGILYCNGRTASTDAVADMALYHLLSCYRHMPWSSRAAVSGSHSAFLSAHRDIPSFAHNPRGRTLAVLGLGEIGYAAAFKARIAFGMKIVYYDVMRKSAEMERALGAEYAGSVEELVACAGENGCILLAATGGGGKVITRDLLENHWAIGANFVNVARGALVDEDALVEALEKGVVGAAGLDVHAQEPAGDERLRAMANGEVLRDLYTHEPIRTQPHGAMELTNGSSHHEDSDSSSQGHGHTNGISHHSDDEEMTNGIHTPTPSSPAPAAEGRTQIPISVTLTSHTGGGARETIEAFERLSMENVEAVLLGREPLTAVNAHLITTERYDG